MYSLLDFGEMITDKGRMDAYVEALRRVIDHDSVVLDIGTGTGIFALLACKFGAHRVYAIEPDDAIQIARDLAAANSFSQRITFIQDLSTRVELPEAATVIISDLRGKLPIYGHHLPSIIDARKRHLAPSGVLIPMQDTLRVALVESPNLYQHYISPWKDNDLGINMQTALHAVMNTMWGSKDVDSRFMAEPKSWATLDYYTLDSPDVEGEMTWQIEYNGAVHGFRVWFDTVLFDELGFTNAPDQTEHIYGSLFFPWQEPVEVEVGDSVLISLKANLVGEDYIWRWNSTVFSQDNPEQKKADYKQSSFDGIPISLSNMRKRAANYKPALNEDGVVDNRIMKMMEQGLILEDISHRIVEQFPERFSDLSQALAYVGQMSIKYSH
jgi:SAM-dependent methyltransferase